MATSRGQSLTPRRPRVVFVDHVARLSGGEIALLRLLPALARDVDVHVILGEDGPARRAASRPRDRDRGDADGAVAARRAQGHRAPSDGCELATLAHLPSYVWRLSRRIRELDADIVHTNSLKAALLGGVAGRLAGKPVVWHIRDRIAPDYLPRSAVALVRAASYVLPSAVVVNSQATLDDAAGPDPQERPLQPGRAGRDRQRRGPRLQDESRVHGRRRRAAGAVEGAAGVPRRVRRGVPRNGRCAGASSGARCSARRGTPRRCASAPSGSGSPGRSSSGAFARTCGPSWPSSTCSSTARSRPSRSARSCSRGWPPGVPVVAADAGGPAEMITNGVDGLLTAPGDVEALAAALRRLHDDAELRARLVRGGSRAEPPVHAGAGDREAARRLRGGDGRSTGGPARIGASARAYGGGAAAAGAHAPRRPRRSPCRAAAWRARRCAAPAARTAALRPSSPRSARTPPGRSARRARGERGRSSLGTSPARTRR